MKMDHDTNETYAIEDTNAPSAGSQDIIYHLYCGMCNEFVGESPENKKVFHSRCLKTVADCDYVRTNPIITSEPWANPITLLRLRHDAFKNYEKRAKKRNKSKK